MRPIRQVLRTPDSAFAELPGWRWGRPSFFTSRLFGTEVRIAYWDLQPEGSYEETLLLTHGEPSWSYLNRRLVGPLLERGYRVVLFDQVGFGWSDKPAEQADYSYERHVAWNEDLLVNHLNLSGVTAVFQDWGGLLGLRVVARHPGRFDRLVVANTLLPTCDPAFEGEGYVSQGFYSWKDFVRRGGLRGQGKIGELLGRASQGPSCGPSGRLSREEEAAYQAPFPDDSFTAGAQAFPELVPTPPSDPTGRPQPEGGEANRAAWAVFAAWKRPVLLAFSDNDPVLGHGAGLWLEKCPGAAGQPHRRVAGGGHFLQDGAGEELARAVIDFVERNPRERLARL